MELKKQSEKSELAICGYNLAINYDYVPVYSEEIIDECIEDIFDNDYSREILKKAMIKFEGYSDGDMTNEIIDETSILIKMIKVK